MEKPSLFLVGIGISDERSLTLEGVFALKECGAVFAESYTNLLPQGTIPRIESLIGKKITRLSREQVEGERKLLASAAERPTALIVAGDPLIATTHVSLLLEAKKQGIAIRIIHASSILSAAICESGLQAYKFGKTATLAYWRNNYKPLSAYDTLAENLSRGAHTLLLLDIDEKLGPMKPSQASKTLLLMEEKAKKGILSEETRVVLLAALGRENQKTAYLALSGISSGEHDTSIPAAIIIPGKLHFVEEEFLQSL